MSRIPSRHQLEHATLTNNLMQLTHFVSERTLKVSKTIKKYIAVNSKHLNNSIHHFCCHGPMGE